ncbi:protease [candidate division KSB1 bacterium]|nr:protease [candidate division KSB1 bacterium]NIR69616.1 protease [candidate division KSB1 bacterium]NIS27461.1 protease [candidate division KSB1 bacterium]NIT74313.1 protease [candidate division KSB1 bacterium]NIU28175.1 protease [candidate division KSB1 bacterium]
MRYHTLCLFLFFVMLSNPTYSQDEARLLRLPSIYDDQIVFTYAGDLYTVAATGGIARKLTNHEGYEMFARFSHDGKSIAFTGQYDGNTEVFLIPSEGGVPRRLTYTATLGRDDVADRMGPNNIVMAWKHDNSSIVFRSRMRSFNSFIGSLYSVTPEGDLPEQLPVPYGGFCSFSPDDKKMAYNRVFREFRTWKKYRGGMADDVWIYDFETREVENITSHPAQDIIPMWGDNKIYFLSDRDEIRRMNLYVYDLTSKETRKLTQYTDFDIKFPAVGQNAIVYEHGGYIYKFDLATEQVQKVEITIANDLLTARDEIKEVREDIRNYEIAPDGNRALFGAHGDVFTVPAKHGRTRNLTNTSGVHDRNSKWSPDGKWISFISDKTGEDEIYIVSQDGNNPPRQITTGAETYKYQPYWSPDSRKLLWSDKQLRLRFVDIQTKEITEVAKATAWEIRDYAWSPDSKWIAYARPEDRVMTKLYLYSLAEGETHEVTEGWFSSTDPAFSSDGKFLYFVSNRVFNPIYSWTEWNHAYQDMERIYFVTLTKDVENPFRPKSDEVKIEEENGKSQKSREKEEEEKKEVVVNVDFDGLKERIVGVPIKASNYWHLTSVGDKLYYNRNGSADEKPLLLMYDFEEQKETELGQINGYEISADKKKILISQEKTYAIIDLPKAKIEIKEKLDLSGMEMRVNRHAEWRQIFHECWRQMREFFYAPNMHGLDWQATREKYEPLVAHVNHRNDLTYIIGEMVGELNAGHTYVAGGDRPSPRRLKTGLLGAQLERDADSKYYRVKKILDGQNWEKSLRSPLTEIGVDVNEGDYILAVNGEPTNAMTNIYEALINTVDKQVNLTVNSRPSIQGSQDVTVEPIGDESDLYYLNWVQDNIDKVNEATNGEVGYVHIPDMGRRGLNEFVKYYYPQIRKKGLIVDVRGNGGGNVSPMIIERLRREAVMFDMARNTSPGPDPDATFLGPIVCLIDEFSASDGDLFAYRFRQHNIGKLIGKRTWGGVVGIRSPLPLVDGGQFYKPEFANYDLKGEKWIIEGHGVEPDIYVDNDPAKKFSGIDEQLNKAIEVIHDEMKTKGKEIPPVPPFPVKN